eukprot:3594836-Ditylum_brightwellii.AAC.1
MHAYSRVYGLLYVRALLDLTLTLDLAHVRMPCHHIPSDVGWFLIPFPVDTAHSVCTKQRDSNPVSSGYESRPLTNEATYAPADMSLQKTCCGFNIIL